MMDDYPETLIAVEWHDPSWSIPAYNLDIDDFYERDALYPALQAGASPHLFVNGTYDYGPGVPGQATSDPDFYYENIAFPAYNSFVNDQTPYVIQMSAYAGISGQYQVTILMDADFDNENIKVDIFLVEDNIWAWWSGASNYANARNVVREWLISENLSINTSGESQQLNGSFTYDESWNLDSLKLIAIVQDHSSKKVHQAHSVSMDPDIDDDDIPNGEDNCIEVSNPLQEDEDNDMVGDICDPCDNLVYILGNINGDLNEIEEPLINIFDILTILDFLDSGLAYPCQESAMDANGDSFVNIQDFIFLVQGILNGTV